MPISIFSLQCGAHMLPMPSCFLSNSILMWSLSHFIWCQYAVCLTICCQCGVCLVGDVYVEAVKFKLMAHLEVFFFIYYHHSQHKAIYSSWSASGNTGDNCCVCIDAFSSNKGNVWCWTQLIYLTHLKRVVVIQLLIFHQKVSKVGLNGPFTAQPYGAYSTV